MWACLEPHFLIYLYVIRRSFIVKLIRQILSRLVFHNVVNIIVFRSGVSRNSERRTYPRKNTACFMTEIVTSFCTRTKFEVTRNILSTTGRFVWTFFFLHNYFVSFCPYFFLILWISFNFLFPIFFFICLSTILIFFLDFVLNFVFSTVLIFVIVFVLDFVLGLSFVSTILKQIKIEKEQLNEMKVLFLNFHHFYSSYLHFFRVKRAVPMRKVHPPSLRHRSTMNLEGPLSK